MVCRAGLPLLCGILALAAIASVSCTRAAPRKEYQLQGQVLAIRAERQEIVIRHEDIEHFMPGMTMPFRVKDRRLLEAAAPGDIVNATLVVQEGDAWLSRVARTGRREPVPADAAVPHRMEPPLEPGGAVPDASFVDQDGRTLQISSLRGRVWALTFVYTRCPLPTFCPALEQRFAAAQRAIAGDAQLEGVQLVSLSIDPAFDRPAVLKAHAERRDVNPRIWRLATGDTETVDRFGERFGLTVVRGDGRPEDFVHSMKTVVVGADGRVRRIYSGAEWTAEELVRELRDAVL